MSNDQEFRVQFAALSREDASRVPDFEQVLQRSRRAPANSVRLLAAASCLLVAAMAAAVLHIAQRARPAPHQPALSLADWRAPTDFLLNTPGRELLRTVPRIGEPSGLFRPFPGLDDHPPSRRTGQEPHS